MLDFWLIALLGFLGSFGHCAGMCGPLTTAFSLSHQQNTSSWQQQIRFHALLNLGRIISYTLVGWGIGGIGSVLVASGQMAGVGSQLRQIIAIVTGILLIWFGLAQIKPDFLPPLPLFYYHFINPEMKTVFSSMKSFPKTQLGPKSSINCQL